MTFQDVISQPPYPGAKPEEIAEIFVIGNEDEDKTRGTGGGRGVFSDWETVWVQTRWREGEPAFRFTATERDPTPEFWNRLQIRPKDKVLIKLGGELAITGVVIVRQTAYDPHSHAVSIQGKGEQWFTWRGAIIDEDNGKMEYKGGIMDIATQIMKPFGTKPTPVGTVDNSEFAEPQHPTPGETVWHFLERLGRDKKVILGGNHLGALLLIGDHVGQIVDELIESVNIISCQCVINILDWYSKYVALGQAKRNGDKGSPADAAQQKRQVDSSFYSKYSPLLVTLEQPVWTPEDIQKRADFEARTGEGTIIEVTVVLYGWFTSRGQPWIHCVGQDVMLKSPMTTLNNERLAIRTVTCTQDSQSGTRTQLELCAPWYLMERGPRAGDTGSSNVPRDPAQGLPGSPSGPSLTPEQRKAGGTPGQSG